MNNIKIQKKFSVQNPVEFCLGNGKRYQFSSKRQSAAFLARTNRYLTKCLVICNETYIELHAQYRRFWLVMANASGGTKTNYSLMASKMKANLQAAEELFEKFNAAWGRSNDPFFAFIDLKKIALFLGEAAGALCDHHKRRNVTAHYYTCLILKERLEILIQKLQEYDYTSDLEWE